TIMSDSEDSTVTYTTVSSPYEGQSGDVSPGVHRPPIPSEDEVFPAEEQPLPAAASPTTDSPGYIPESDPEDDDDEDLEEDPADYPADHDDDDDEEEPSGNDADEEDEEQDEDDDDEEEEHPASADSIPPPPALRLLSSDRKADRPEVTLSPRKRLSIVHCPGYEAGESSIAAAARPIEGRRADYGFAVSVEAEIRRRIAKDIGYGIRDTWIDPRDVAEEEALTTLEGFNTREAIISREAWAHSIGLNSTVYFELQGYMTHTWVQDQRIDAHDTLIATLTIQLSSLQGHLATTLGEIRVLQAREQARAGAPDGAGSST
nr:hypothetical protein [Tanacetum cinerariifolium]